MQTRRLGYTNVELTTVGLGTWAIGGGNNPYGWGRQSDADSIAAIRRALDRGINWLDTAAGYGRGHAEDVVGQALTGRRDQAFIATKCGILWKEDGSDIYGHLKRDSIRREIEGSLRRLRTDVIDLYQIHWPLPDEDIEEGWATHRRLDPGGQGQVRWGIELRRQPVEAAAGHSSGRFRSTALQPAHARSGGRAAPLLRSKPDWGSRLQSHGAGPLNRHVYQRSRQSLAGGRPSPNLSTVPGAAAQRQFGAHREAARRCHARRRDSASARHRLGVASP
jgi:hypothetical protein